MAAVSFFSQDIQSLDLLAASCLHEAALMPGKNDFLFNSCVLPESNNSNKFFPCPFGTCNRDFTSKRNLVDHIRSHHEGNKPHRCVFPGCGKSFLRPAHLLIHNRIHTGEKPFMCEYQGCGKRWNQKSALKQHMRSHTGEKPFGCTIAGCNKRFSTSSSCKRHVLTHDKPHGAAKPYFRKRSHHLDMNESSGSSSDEEYVPTTASEMSSPIVGSPASAGAAVTFTASEEELSVQLCKMAMNFILN